MENIASETNVLISGHNKKRGAWTEDEILFLKNNYKSMTMEELCDSMNRTDGSIRGMKSKLGLIKKNRKITENEVDIIRDYYQTHDANNFDMNELMNIVGRSENSIGLIASRHGFADYHHGHKSDLERAKMKKRINEYYNSEYYQTIGRQLASEKTKNQFKEKGHPKGFFGKHHTQEVCDIISAAVKERFSNMTYQEKHEIAMRAVQTKIENGTINNTTSNSYSRARGGKREDLNNSYFRSAWEANIARVLNYLQINWQYELRRFYFEDSVDGVLSYQPDFYLPEFDMWIEVKGWMDEKSKTRLKLFKEQYPEEYNKLMLIDQKRYYELECDYKFLPNWEGNGVYHNKLKTLEE